MKIFLIILGILVLFLTVVLLLPVRFIIRNDDENRFYFRVKFLWFTFGGPKKVGKPSKGVRKKAGIEQLELESIKAKIKRDGLIDTLTVVAQILKTVFSRLSGVLKHSRADKFDVTIVCSANDAADSAIRYGNCCAIIYPLLGFINSIINVNRKNRNIDISCKYGGVSEVLRYDFVLSVRVVFLLVAALKLLVEYISLKRKSDL